MSGEEGPAPTPPLSEVLPSNNSSHTIADLPPPPVNLSQEGPVETLDARMNELKKDMAVSRKEEGQMEDYRRRLEELQSELEGLKIDRNELASLRQEVDNLHAQLGDTHTKLGQDNFWFRQVLMMQAKLDDLEASKQAVDAEKQKFQYEVYLGESPDVKMAYRIKEIERDNIRLRRLLQFEKDKNAQLVGYSSTGEYLVALSGLWKEYEASLKETVESLTTSLSSPAPPPPPPPPPQGADELPQSFSQNLGTAILCAHCRCLMANEERGDEHPKLVPRREGEPFPTPYFATKPPPPPDWRAHRPMTPADMIRAEAAGTTAILHPSPNRTHPQSVGRLGLVTDFPQFTSSSLPRPSASPQQPKNMCPPRSPHSDSAAPPVMGAMHLSHNQQASWTRPPNVLPHTPQRYADDSPTPQRGTTPKACAVFSDGGWQPLTRQAV